MNVIHRSNLIGMGVLPIQLKPGLKIKDLQLSGDEIVDINIDLEKIMKKNTKEVKISIINSF